MEPRYRECHHGSGKKRASYFSSIELEILMQAYGEREHIFRRKSNTAAAAKEREAAWEEIAARVNASNLTGEKRSWKQLKMKYKNIIQSANRKKAEARKTGGGPPPPPLTEAEKTALSQNYGRPAAEGTPGGSSSEPLTPEDTSACIRFEDGVICLVQPPETIEHPAAEDDDDEETLFAATGRDPEGPTENMAGRHEQGPSTSTAQLDTLPAKDLYRMHLIKTIQKADKEMVLLDRKIRKADLEIQLLERQLRWRARMSEEQKEEQTEEQTVSLVDVLEEDEELEEEASAVLAGSDSDHCSYPQGYVKRQALYACNTCTPRGGEAAGVCLACSYKCHEGHDLFELYTKRNFRCDCGNRKFTELQCKLYPEKDELNSLNKYSHNFFGVYCTCGRPYPDPDDQVEDEMIQCVVCEDWLHGRHLGCVLPDSVELQEMICESCMNRNPFLWTYAAHLAVPGAAVQQVKEESGADESKPSVPLKEEDKGDDVVQPSCKRSREEAESSCRLKELQLIGQKRVQSGAVFWPSAWRSKLCSCNSCQERLSDAGLSFLLDESDTVLAYENKGKNNEETRQGHDPLMSALDNLNRVQQLEIIHGYNDMKTELKDFLQRFATEGKVVTPDDIRQFFEQQQSRKRQRVDAGRFYCT